MGWNSSKQPDWKVCIAHPRFRLCNFGPNACPGVPLFLFRRAILENMHVIFKSSNANCYISRMDLSSSLVCKEECGHAGFPWGIE